MQAGSWQLAEIYPSSSEAVEADLSPLKINGSEAKFLRQTILDDCQFLMDQAGNWYLRFFVNTELEQRLFVRLVSDNDAEALRQQRGHPRDRAIQPLTRLVFAHVSSNDKTLDAVARQASLILKDSQAVTEQHLLIADHYQGYIDGRGEIFLSKHANDPNFKRHILLHALALSYMMVMSQLKHRLKPGLAGRGDVHLLRAIYQDFVRFNAHYFYMQPALHDRPAMCEAWQRIDNSYRACAENQELFDKVKSVHFLLDLENSEKEAAHREKNSSKMNQLNFTVGVFAAIVTFVALFVG